MIDMFRGRSIDLAGAALLGTTMLVGPVRIAVAADASKDMPTPATAPAAAPAAKSALSEIVVTATKRKSTVQTTPIAMSVYRRDELARQDVHDLQSLAQIAPDVNFRQSSGSPIITIRGISSSDTSEIGDPAVAVSTDGVYLNRPYALNASLYDLDRIEVLRGPQGTLNGRNAVGGAINVLTAKPETKTRAFTSLEVGNYGTINSQAMVNLPLSDTMQLRLAEQTQDENGYRKIPPFGRADDERSRSGRATLAWQPISNLHGTITGEYTHLGGVGQAQQLVPLVTDAAGNTVHGMPAIPGYSVFPSLAKPHRDVNDYNLRWQFDYTLPFATVTYLGGYNKIDYHNANNNSAAYTSTFNVNEHPETLNQELHIASDPVRRLFWLGGLYFFHEANSIHSYVLRPGSTGAQVVGNTYRYDTTARSLAGFATLGYKITPTLKLTGGMRLTRDDKSRDGYTYYADVSTNPVTYSPVSGYGRANWTKPTWHVGLDWQAAPRNLLYAKFDTGYKPGGFTTVSDYGPETLKAWEIGSKNRFFHNRLELDLSAYYQDYTGQQVNQYVVSGGELQETTVNAGKSRIYGVEPEISLDTGMFGVLTADVQWMHARFTDFDYVGTQYAGNRLPQAPDLSFSLGLLKTLQVSFGSFQFEVRSKYSGSQYINFTNYGEEHQTAYTETNVNLAFSPPSGRWRLEGYVRNLENAHILTDAVANPYAAAYRFSYAPPRTFGGKFSIWF